MASTIHTLVLVAFFLLLLQRRKLLLRSSSSTISSSPVVRLPDDPILRKSKFPTRELPIACKEPGISAATRQQQRGVVRAQAGGRAKRILDEGG
jgi:hypothetical protein